MPNRARNTGFYRFFRLLTPLECSAVHISHTFTQWKSQLSIMLCPVQFISFLSVERPGMAPAFGAFWYGRGCARSQPFRFRRADRLPGRDLLLNLDGDRVGVHPAAAGASRRSLSSSA